MKPPTSPLRRRGQPLLALILLMTSWIGARAAMWEDPVVTTAAPSQSAAGPASRQSAPAPAVRRSAPATAPASAGPAARPPGQAVPRFDAPLPQGAVPQLPEPQFSPPPASPPGTAAPAAAPPLSPRVAAGHQQLWLGAMALMPVEQGGAAEVAPARLPRSGQAAAAADVQQRWSGDSWLLLRAGSNGFNAPGSGLPGVYVPLGFYGGSQAGAVLRYRLAVTSPYRPSLYLRGSSGLEYPRGEELALGLSLRPVPRLPVALLLEGRVTRTVSGEIVRPAAALVSELPPVRLPLGTRGEVYVQAGYVGGRDGTAFIDGQARIERPLVQAGGFQLRAGGGAWGGAQRGANRVDVGPTATLAVPIGPAGARLSADYRFRVVGNAAPGSGPVLTLSAGF